MTDLPFDGPRLDQLLDGAGVDALLVTSKHAVQYLLGGYRFFWFAHMDAVGVSRYLPVLGYLPGCAHDAFYVGNGLEGWQLEHEPIWPPEVSAESWTSEQAATEACEQLARRGFDRGRLAVEMPFLPADALHVVQRELPGVELVDAVPILEELRAVKTPDELDMVRRAGNAIIDSMLEVFVQTEELENTAMIAERMRQAEVARGLTFEYCLVAAGPSGNRAPGPVPWRAGEPLSLDSGGNFGGYIGDMARMAVLGAPSEQLVDALGQVEAVQQAAKGAVRAGATGNEIFSAALAQRQRSADARLLYFVAHGMGLISHEAPRLTASGPVPYPANYTDVGVRSGMVLSIETDLRHPALGFIKLEDTVIVEADGYEEVAGHGHGWNVVHG